MGDTANKVSLTDFYAPPPPPSSSIVYIFCPACPFACFFLLDRTFIFHKCIPLGKSFSLVPRSRSSVKVKYHCGKNGHCGGIRVSQTHSCSSKKSL